MARDSRGRWLPGASPNPKGGKPGVTWQAKLRRELKDDVPKIARKLVGMAMEGDTAAADLILKRTLPQVREDQITLPWGPDDSIEARSTAVLMAVASGHITTEQAGRLALLLKTHADLSMVLEMRRELDELKEKLG